MTLEWLRRHDPVLDRHLRTYLFVDADILEVEEAGRARRRAPTTRPAAASASAACATTARTPCEPPDAGQGADHRRRPGPQIDAEATRSLTHFLAGRKLVDFSGPHGWEHSAVDLGRVAAARRRARSHGVVAGPPPGAAADRAAHAVHAVAWPSSTPPTGAPTDLDLDAVIAAARPAAMAEDGSLFHGYAAGRHRGHRSSSRPHPTGRRSPTTTPTTRSHVAKAVAILRAADVGGPTPSPSAPAATRA